MSEVGTTWNCGNDTDTSNGAPNCPGETWEMNQNRSFSWIDPPTNEVLFMNSTGGIMEWDVTTDV